MSFALVLVINILIIAFGVTTFGVAIRHSYILSAKTYKALSLVPWVWGAITIVIQIVLYVIWHYTGGWQVVVALSNMCVELLYTIPMCIYTSVQHRSLLDQRILAHIHLLQQEDGVLKIRNACIAEYGIVYSAKEIQQAITRQGQHTQYD